MIKLALCDERSERNMGPLIFGCDCKTAEGFGLSVFSTIVLVVAWTFFLQFRTFVSA